MVDSICIFEGIYYSRLLPLVYLRPEYDLRSGILSLREKVLKRFPKIPTTLHCRSYLSELVKLKNPDLLVNEINGNHCLFINGRVLMDDDLAKILVEDTIDTLYVKGDSIIAAKVSGLKLEQLKKGLYDLYTLSDFGDLFIKEIEARIINYPWELVHFNGAEIINDFNLLTKDKVDCMIRGNVYEGAYLIAKENIYIDEGTKIMPGAVLDAEKGPIYIGKDSVIQPNATIVGPSYIGNRTYIRASTSIYERTSIGDVCKIGGEVEDSVIHSYTNKQHGGFLGHAYLGSWVNLGADTNNSNLKNNYGSIRVRINDQLVDSGLQFVGLMMGDHSKTSINTMFNTATVVGVGSNVFGAGFPPKYIPSFCWGGAESLTTYDIERSLEVAQRVMTRRDVKFTSLDEKLLRKVFDLTKEERRRRGMPS